MRVLVDEYLPRAVKLLFRDHDCRTVREMGWSGKKNGALLTLAEKEFDVLVTIDQGMEHEQTIAGRKLGLLVLSAPSNQVDDSQPIIPDALLALRTIRPWQVIRVGR
jgi:hypothetical protein